MTTESTNTPISKYQDLTRLALTPAQTQLKADWDSATASLCRINNCTAKLYDIKRERRLKVSEREELAFLNGQHELIKKQFDAAAGAYATAIESDMRNHVLHYVMTALESAGLPGFIDYNSKRSGYYSDVYYQPKIGCAKLRVQIQLDWKTGTLSEITFNTEPDASGNYHSFRITRNWKHNDVHEYVLGTWYVSTSCLSIQPDESQSVMIALSFACQVASSLYCRIPGDAAIAYMNHTKDMSDFVEYERHLEERAKRKATAE
jgi:hypothetical protein